MFHFRCFLSLLRAICIRLTQYGFNKALIFLIKPFKLSISKVECLNPATRKAYPGSILSNPTLSLCSTVSLFCLFFVLLSRENNSNVDIIILTISLIRRRGILAIWLLFFSALNHLGTPKEHLNSEKLFIINFSLSGSSVKSY